MINNDQSHTMVPYIFLILLTVIKYLLQNFYKAQFFLLVKILVNLK